MSTHLVLARQYRPRLFSEVIGQDIFVTLIKNALHQDRIGHAFLLTGIRGIGKTTIARLIAKAVTCTQRTEDNEPCNTCPSCIALISDAHMDIVEMDAASHTGVDDMRHILDGSTYKPITSPYKVYIIDEAHMLSKSAFNALLKLLEEPPSHVKFILATTEVGKIPATVVSRCQQLHLKRLNPTAMTHLLTSICAKEGFTIDQDALDALCQYSEGSARDALSLLEKTLVSVGKRTTIERRDIDTSLGLIPDHEMTRFIDAVHAQDLDAVLTQARRFYSEGTEPVSILRQILSRLYGRMMDARAEPASPQRQQAIESIDRLWAIVHNGLTEVATSPFPFLALEMVVLRLTYVGRFPTPGQLLNVIESDTVPEHGPAAPHSATGTETARNPSSSTPSSTHPVHRTPAHKQKALSESPDTGATLDAPLGAPLNTPLADSAADQRTPSTQPHTGKAPQSTSPMDTPPSTQAQTIEPSLSAHTTPAHAIVSNMPSDTEAVSHSATGTETDRNPSSSTPSDTKAVHRAPAHTIVSDMPSNTKSASHNTPHQTSGTPSDTGAAHQDPGTVVLTPMNPSSPDGKAFYAFIDYLTQKKEALLVAHIKQSVSVVRWDTDTCHVDLHWHGDHPVPISVSDKITHHMHQWRNATHTVTWVEHPIHTTMAQDKQQDALDIQRHIENSDTIIELKKVFPGLGIQSIDEGSLPE